MRYFPLFLCIVLCAPVLAATDPEVAAYSIPADAVKREPLPSRDTNETRYSYVPAKLNSCARTLFK